MQPGSRWVHRPAFWCQPVVPSAATSAGGETRIGDVSLFHDAAGPGASWRQVPVADSRGQSFVLKLETAGFAGTYLSLALSLPQGLLKTLTRKSVLALDSQCRAENGFAANMRLNLRHGPNTFEFWHTPDKASKPWQGGFELAGCQIDPAMAEEVWFDLIVARPATNVIEISDLTISHRLRAEF